MRTCAAMVALLGIPAAFSQPMVTRDGTSTEGALKTVVTVTVRGLSDYLKSNNGANSKFVLYLQGIPFANLAVSGPTPGHDELRFYLDRVDTNRDQWNALLRKPVPVREIPLTVGVANGAIFPSEVDNFNLKIYNPAVLYASGALFLVILFLFVWVAIRSDVLREAGPPPPAPKVGAPVPRRAYSLGRVQMAVWFFVVAASFMLIWIITFGLDTIPPTVLALIGISTATGMAAAVVDTSKAASMRSQRDQLLAEDGSLTATISAAASKPAPPTPEDLQKQQEAQNRRAIISAQVADLNKQIDTPAHESFLMDILSDANGVSFHRFQMTVWTMILVIIFAISVFRDLVMPDFNATLLGLMGISSGTYIGFKFPEVKN